jgi:hypothetical protein
MPKQLREQLRRITTRLREPDPSRRAAQARLRDQRAEFVAAQLTTTGQRVQCFAPHRHELVLEAAMQSVLEALELGAVARGADGLEAHDPVSRRQPRAQLLGPELLALTEHPQ